MHISSPDGTSKLRKEHFLRKHWEPGFEIKFLRHGFSVGKDFANVRQSSSLAKFVTNREKST
jgi:hypothetical protein